MESKNKKQPNQTKLKPPTAGGKKPKNLTDLQNIPEPKRKQQEPESLVADNPWANDPLGQPQYYIELGGVSKFLHFRRTLNGDIP